MAQVTRTKKELQRELHQRRVSLSTGGRKARPSRELLREVIQQRKILSASLDLSDSLDVIAAKHKLTATDVLELLNKHTNHALNVVVLSKRR